MTGSALFPPPKATAGLYIGQVMHARMKPKVHRFQYRVFTLLIDIDRLTEAGKLSRFFSIGRFNLLSFREADHASRGRPLRSQIDELLREAGCSTHATRVLLLCYPRVLGFVFNPISVYFAYAENGELLALIYEVRNTFGEMHSYVAPVVKGELTEAGIRQEREKRFYVSPFLDMPMRYHFRIRPPTEQIALRILETDSEGPILAATFNGLRSELTAWTILKTLIELPFMTLKVVAGINWEALKLWMKGVRIYRRPEPPERASFGDGGNRNRLSDATGTQ